MGFFKTYLFTLPKALIGEGSSDINPRFALNRVTPFPSLSKRPVPNLKNPTIPTTIEPLAFPELELIDIIRHGI